MSRAERGRQAARKTGFQEGDWEMVSLDLILDQVEARKREVTIDVRDFTAEQKESVIKLAKQRGFDAASDGNHVLVRDLRKIKFQER
jgi:hypothetical protein